MNQTLKQIERILTSAYDTSGFVDFIREIFPGVRILSPDSFHKEYSNFSSHIEGQAHVGSYTDPEGKIVSIHAVRLVKESYVENSRSTQRSYAKKLIENGNADAAIIAFYTEDDPKWRLSFVRLDYEIKFENGKLNTQENMTPAKRYSFLVGKDEPCYTAISRFRRFIIDDEGAVAPTIDDLEEAFSVEKVTDEFFNLYCEKFYQLRDALEANEDFVIEAQQHNFTSEQFAKKLMGQIVFLYFLQKKGWLGVPAWPNELNEKEYKDAFFAHGAKSRELLPKVYIKVSEDRYRVSAKALEEISDEDEALLASCVKGQPWGSGSKTFMRTLFNYSQRKKANFFDDFLEPLFYDALNVNRGEQGYDPALHCRIPFLSGGLFEPIDGYDWKHNNFDIPNEVFSNKKDENDRDADGILDIFDRYNFTMSEDEPLEREVAIDPEMLGKVFENLLEIKDRKSKGAFYTPREIVHYMCQESLISYLVKETGLKEQDIRDFILLGDFMKDEDTSKDKRQGIHDMMISEDIYKIDQDGKIVVDRLKDIDDALANIRVADCCCGSGGMFVQSERFAEGHSHNRGVISVYGQEANPDTWKMAKINMAIRGIDADLGPYNADTFTNDLHPTLKADYILANPPFNYHPWGQEQLKDDVRWKYGLPPAGNANYAWIQHMIHHLAPNGKIGLVLANGALSTQTSGEGEIRKNIINDDLIEGIVAMPTQLFYSVTIPVTLWFITKNKKQAGKTVFIDARKMGHMVDRKHRDFSDEDIQKLADTFSAFQNGTLEDVKGFCAVATTQDIAKQDYILTPGRYVSIEEQEDDGEPFEEKMDRLTSELSEMFKKSHELEDEIRKKLGAIGYEI